MLRKTVRSPVVVEIFRAAAAVYVGPNSPQPTAQWDQQMADDLLRGALQR